MSFLCIAALLLAYAVLKYFCIFRSSMLARLALLKKSCAILHSHLCVLRRCCSHMRCSNTFVYSAPLCSRALHYSKNPAQFRIFFFAYCGVAAPSSVLKYFCILCSSSVARLALPKKSCAISHSHLCVLRRCCSCLRCSSTFVYSAPLCSRALLYSKNPAQFRATQ